MEITPEIQDAIDEAVAGLKAKNSDLLAKLAKAQKGQEIDPKIVADLEEQVDKLQGDLSASQKAVKDSAKAFELLQNQLKAESGFTQKLLVDNGLTDALVKNGIAAPYLDAVKALFAGQAQIVADGDNRIAKVGEKPLTEFVAEWSKTEQAKHFIKAPTNTGGGSLGGNHGSSGIDLSGLKPTDRINAARAAKA